MPTKKTAKKEEYPVIKGYKAFNRDMTCNGFQYEEGKEFEIKEAIQICQTGFHFCKDPLDCLTYYDITTSEFHEVESLGETQEHSDDSKVVTSRIRIGAKLDLSAFIKASFGFIWNRATVSKSGNATSGYRANSATSGDGANSATSGDGANSATSGDDANSATSGYGAHSATSGNDAHSATSGNYAHSATSGYRANSATSGYGAHSATSLENAIACSVGRKAKAKGAVGSWIVLAEWYEGKEFTDAYPVGVTGVKVDGKKVKADTWYKLVGGEFVETDDSNE